MFMVTRRRPTRQVRPPTQTTAPQPARIRHPVRLTIEWAVFELRRPRTAHPSAHANPPWTVMAASAQRERRWHPRPTPGAHVGLAPTLAAIVALGILSRPAVGAPDASFVARSWQTTDGLPH